MTSVALSAYPFVRCILDAKFVDSGLQTGGSDERRGCKLYTDIMAGFKSLYESADNVLLNIRKIVEYIMANEFLEISLPGTTHQGIPSRNNNMLVSKARQNLCEPENAWTELFSGNSQCYLRIAMIVDFSLSCGRFPTEDDFPKPLQIAP
ncbi:hypothetical protein BJ170DRAFT_466, partial [Xylariales sp. AK1849]